MSKNIDTGFVISENQSTKIFFGTADGKRGAFLWVGNFSRDAAFRIINKYNSDINKIMTHAYIVDRCKAKNKGA